MRLLLFVFLSTQLVSLAQATDPTVATARSLMGRIESREAGEALLRQYVASHPDDAEAALLMGLAAEGKAKQDPVALRAQVLPLYERALMIWRSHTGTAPAQLARALEANARVLTRLGEGQAAAPLVTEAEAMRKKSIEIRRAAAPAGDQVYQVNTPGMVKPKLLRHSEPEYSEEARMAKVQGSVMIDIVIDSAGKPWVVGERRTLGSGLDEQAMLAVEAWQFAPATLNGQPVAVRATVDVSFRLL